MSSKSWVVLYCAQAPGDAGLAHRDFQPQVERLALGISTVAVLASYIWLHNSSRKFLLRAFTIVLVLFLASIVVSILLGMWLGSLTTRATIDGTVHLWKWIYLLVLLSESLAVVLFTLWVLAPRQDTPSSATDRSRATLDARPRHAGNRR
jgi:ABC-type sugar transport system permease subunit